MNPLSYEPHPCPQCNGTGKDPQKPRGGKCRDCRGTGRQREYVVILVRDATDQAPAHYQVYAVDSLLPAELQGIYCQSPKYFAALDAQVRMNKEAREEWRLAHKKPPTPRPPSVCSRCGERIARYKTHIVWAEPFRSNPPLWRCACTFYLKDGRTRLKWRDEWGHWMPNRETGGEP